MDIETTNFENFTAEEYRENLLRLGVDKHTSLINKEVYYVMKEYGIHKVIKWDSDKASYLLEIEEQRFWSNPFRILYNG